MDELDPAQRLQLDALDEEYRRRHGVAVAFLKAEVGEGDTYANEAARTVISPNGAWFECVDLPMEFSGTAGAPVAHRFVSDSEACALLDRLHALMGSVDPDNTREFGLFVLYERTGIVDERSVYVFQHRRRADGMTRRPQQFGAYRTGVLPLVYRCRLDTDLDTTGIPVHRGVIFCLARIGEKNLVVEMPYEGEELRDLAERAIHPTAQ